MELVNKIVDAIGHVIGKIVALSGIAAISAALGAFQANPSIGMVALIVVAAAVVWQKGIIPVVDEALAALQPKVTAVGKVKAPVKNYLSLI